ncbi:heparinase II/III family protein [Paenibacillus gallinarum]|uniref:Heparinase II/III family protein n=1 Tax=Paenibacillus gallinarum TaxID=2762232 RepID=A0ABR8SYQ4_9BACL|nr:heparinase II/III family protein [Paenibacillus gallinarum]MBD7968620.1 heparinase II/III family protein [Paenibacillus gallinarum]
MEMSRTDKDKGSSLYVDRQNLKEALSARVEKSEADSAAFAFGITNWRQRLRCTQEEPHFTKSWEQVRWKASQALNEPLPQLSFAIFRQFAETGERKAYEDVYFERRARLNALAVVTAVITDKQEHQQYLASLENVIWDICGEYTWCLTAHLPREGDPSQEVDLFAAETAQTLAEIYAMHQEVLDARIAERIRIEVRRRVLTPVFTEKRSFFWRSADHNWSAVCAGGSGMAALILMNDQEEKTDAMMQTLESMQSFLSGYEADGGCAEGLGYWVYGFGYYTYFAEMLREYSHGKIDLLTTEHVRSIARFPSSIHLSDGVYVNFSDSSEREVLPSGLLNRIAERTGCIHDFPSIIPGMLDDPVRRWAHLIRNFLWSDTEQNKGEKQMENQIAATSDISERAGLRTVIFPNLGWWVSRGKFSGFALKGGDNGEPHNHNDLGQIIIHGGGENLLCDLGAGMYSKAYFQEGRESIINISSGGHSVPVIGGHMQKSGPSYSAKVLKTKSSEKELQVVLDLTHAYGEAPIHYFTRSILFKCHSDGERSIVELEDVFEWKGIAESIEERLISRIGPIFERDTVIWSGSRARLILRYDSALWAASSIATAHFTHEGEPYTFYTTSLVSKEQEGKQTKCQLQFEIEDISSKSRHKTPIK